MKESTEKVVWSCGYCGKLHWDKVSADVCHQDRTCSECGVVIGKNSYYMLCGDCREKKAIEKEMTLFEKAKKYTVEEYRKEFPDHYAVYDGDRYFDIDDWMYEFEEFEQTPKFVWGTKKEIVTLDPYDFIQTFEENVEIEDFELDKAACESIKEFCKNWNEKYSEVVYNEDTSIAIILG